MVTGKAVILRAAANVRASVWLLAGLLAWVSVPCEAVNFNFPGNFGPPQGPGGWQFRPQDPSNARGTPPTGTAPGGPQPGWGDQTGNPWNPYPGMQPSWGGQQYSPYAQQRPSQPQIDPPRVEAEIGNLQPYVQENVLLITRLISTANLDTANAEMPPSNEVLFQKLQGPTAHSRTGSQGRQEIVNEFVYAVTALRPGQIEVPPIRFTGTQSTSGYGSRGGVPFDVSSQQTLHLQVRPAMPSVQPWLPLEQLTLKATFDRPEKAEEGQPVTLVLQLDAIGGGGTQLPSLEPELQAGDFRVYREQTITDSKLSPDGNHLLGMRAEFFTLVPRSGGKLRLPELRVPWWNVKTGAKEFASLPIRTLQVEGESGPFGLPTGSTLIPAGAAGFWLPIAGLALLVSGYWVGVWYKGRRIAGKEPLPLGLQAHLGAALARLVWGIGAAWRRIDPRPWLKSVGPWLQTLLPASLRFWMCVRQADPEPDPAVWSARLQALSCKNLRISDRVPLPTMAEHIARVHPSANSEKLRALLQELDSALYGQKTLDFPRWKHEFKQQVRPRPVSAGIFRLSGWYRRARLPELNPRVG